MGRTRVFGFERGDLLDGKHVGWIGSRRCVEPGIKDFACNCFRGAAQTQAEDIGMIPEACPFGGFRIVTEGGTDARYLVGGKTDPCTCPTAKDPFVGLMFDDSFGNGLCDLRPIQRIAAERTEERNFMAAFFELCHERIRKMSFFVGTYSKFHTFPVCDRAVNAGGQKI